MTQQQYQTPYIAIIAWLTTAALAVLKIAGLATYSWWIVFAPLIASFAFWIALLSVVFIGAAYVTWAANRLRRGF